MGERIQALEERIELALARSGRRRSEITVVAVTKKFSAERILEAHAAGLRHFGENYVQEFAQKYEAVRQLPDATFHLIGHLQSNKVRTALDLFQVIETVDSAKLLRRLDSMAASGTEALFEIKLSDEESKTGAPESAIGELAAAARECSRLRVTGLMTVPPWSTDPEVSRPYFRKLSQLGRMHGFSKLSMGMSGDFEVAIEEGATIIRVGTALFGPRPKVTGTLAVNGR